MDFLRVMIADDEPPARAMLRMYLERIPGVEVVAEAVDGMDALEKLAGVRPDLLLLDIRMPGLDGFEVLEAMPDESPVPEVVFVTAHDDQAVRAFEVEAVDYLLKPVSEERLGQMLVRVRKILAARSPESSPQRERTSRAAEAVRTPGFARRFVVREREHYLLVRTEELIRVESAANYASLHTAGRSHLLRATLAALEQQLDPDRFVRIHRAHIVNLDQVARVVPDGHGDGEVVLKDGTTLPFSRTYRDRLLATPGADGPQAPG